MELTHGHHFMARRLAVVDGPSGMCNALAYHMPQKMRNKIGDLIARCHDEQFRYVDRAREDIMEFQRQATFLQDAFVDYSICFHEFFRRNIVTMTDPSDGGSQQINKVISIVLEGPVIHSVEEREHLSTFS